MDLTIKDLSPEQYDKILTYAKQQVQEKFILKIFYDTCDCPEIEKGAIFNKEGIEDVKIKNNLRDYCLYKELESDFDIEEIEKEGYFVFYIEGYSHSGITLYEFSGALRDRWDCGIAGAIAIKSKDFKLAYESFKEFINFWNKLNNDEFYGYRIENNFGDDIDCRGSFWELEELKESLPSYITEEQFKQACDNIQY